MVTREKRSEPGHNGPTIKIRVRLVTPPKNCDIKNFRSEFMLRQLNIRRLGTKKSWFENLNEILLHFFFQKVNIFFFLVTAAQLNVHKKKMTLLNFL